MEETDIEAFFKALIEDKAEQELMNLIARSIPEEEILEVLLKIKGGGKID